MAFNDRLNPIRFNILLPCLNQLLKRPCSALEHAGPTYKRQQLLSNVSSSNVSGIPNSADEESCDYLYSNCEEIKLSSILGNSNNNKLNSVLANLKDSNKDRDYIVDNTIARDNNRDITPQDRDYIVNNAIARDNNRDITPQDRYYIIDNAIARDNNRGDIMSQDRDYIVDNTIASRLELSSATLSLGPIKPIIK